MAAAGGGAPQHEGGVAAARLQLLVFVAGQAHAVHVLVILCSTAAVHQRYSSGTAAVVKDAKGTALLVAECEDDTKCNTTSKDTPRMPSPPIHTHPPKPSSTAPSTPIHTHPLKPSSTAPSTPLTHVSLQHLLERLQPPRQPLVLRLDLAHTLQVDGVASTRQRVQGGVGVGL